VKPRVSMREALDDVKLLGSVLKADSRRGWRNAPDSSLITVISDDLDPPERVVEAARQGDGSLGRT
jgi:hypothetical protein